MEKSLSQEELDDILESTDVEMYSRHVIKSTDKLLTTNEYTSFLVLAIILENLYL